MRYIRLIYFVPVVSFLFWVSKSTEANLGVSVNHLKTVALQTQTIPGITFFAGTKKLAVVDSWGSALLVWDTSTWEMIAKIVEPSGFPRAAVSSPNGQLLAVLKRPGKGTRIEIYNGATMVSAGIIEEENDATSEPVFSPDSKLLAFATWRPDHWLIRVWDVVRAKQVSSLVTAREDEIDGSVHGLAFSPDATFLATGTHEGKVRLWNVKSGRIVRTFGTLRAHNREASYVKYSPDGKYLASGDTKSEPVVKIWNPNDGREVHSIRLSDDPIDQIQGLAFDPQGKFLAMASMQKIALFSVGDWKELWARPKEDHERGFAHVTFSPDGALFAFISYPSLRTPGKSKELEVWKVSPVANR